MQEISQHEKHACWEDLCQHVRLLRRSVPTRFAEEIILSNREGVLKNKLQKYQNHTRVDSNIDPTSLNLVQNWNYLLAYRSVLPRQHRSNIARFLQRVDDVVFEKFSHSTSSKTLRQQERINKKSCQRSMHILFERRKELCHNFY